WMPKQLKDALEDHLRKRCAEVGTPDFYDMIATEEDAETSEQLLEFLSEKGHPALTMDMMF
ncbi:MAG: hypothetical protein KAS77_02405, partial [Thermoplasmata archaeon]|nr:hypothetical protein [Thermoplasmata archaeon]